MKIKILIFRANMVYRLSLIADKVFCWGCKRHNELYEQIIRKRRKEL